MKSDPDTLNPVLNHDAQEAGSIRYANHVVMIVPLKSGRFGIFDRGFVLRGICDEAPSSEELRELSQLFNQRMHLQTLISGESHYLGEPTPKDLARDLKAARRPPKRKNVASTDEAIEIDLEI